MPPIPISYPARYAPAVAINFADDQGHAVLVSQESPLPVTFAGAAPASGSGTPTPTPTPPPPLAGTSATSQVAGPFAPIAGRPLVLTLAGTWTGTVQLLRSVDGGATRHPLTVGGAVWARFTANACEQVWEEAEGAARFYLSLAPASGTVQYRLAQ